ncbi:type II secretion system protein [Colwellia sp. MB02u-18]|uniref:type IV pilus modification PilV family protein n=1 Tax=unclassified Colwellia TaxID=196834 RepID=UPI0015F6EFAE|nr:MULTISPECIES: type II secretion system protein [unclassified Colwellia]MBA6223731.1 type II secretion system protein [Colwellia sp. MB3u-45]MBA6268461.1 type II secretion system protein [Colwellia sp. MB3u-43]MBA6319912.1 type II secretion system protein [Colwellia sp. MB02u-19]MBA6324544.1 type II secretion system protein [Colwellia sp. MB02u-18]MBA6330699.1 type II secretion system protein [Colwellia sp. MB02u-12]
MRFKQKVSPTLTLPTKASQQGFTLIEIIVGIVVLSIAFSIFTTLIYPLANQSAKQVHQIKAAELGQSMINEIIAKAFDENSDKSGGIYRCGESGATACSSTLADEESGARERFDDVDDYNNLSIMESSLGGDDSLNDIYVGYQINVKVINDSDYDGDHDDEDDISTAKLITVTVTTPQDFDFVFAVYRANF